MVKLQSTKWPLHGKSSPETNRLLPVFALQLVLMHACSLTLCIEQRAAVAFSVSSDHHFQMNADLLNWILGPFSSRCSLSSRC